MEKRKVSVLLSGTQVVLRVDTVGIATYNNYGLCSNFVDVYCGWVAKKCVHSSKDTFLTPTVHVYMYINTGLQWKIYCYYKLRMCMHV